MQIEQIPTITRCVEAWGCRGAPIFGNAFIKRVITQLIDSEFDEVSFTFSTTLSVQLKSRLILHQRSKTLLFVAGWVSAFTVRQIIEKGNFISHEEFKKSIHAIQQEFLPGYVFGFYNFKSKLKFQHPAFIENTKMCVRADFFSRFSEVGMFSVEFPPSKEMQKGQKEGSFKRDYFIASYGFDREEVKKLVGEDRYQGVYMVLDPGRPCALCIDLDMDFSEHEEYRDLEKRKELSEFCISAFLEEIRKVAVLPENLGRIDLPTHRDTKFSLHVVFLNLIFPSYILMSHICTAAIKKLVILLKDRRELFTSRGIFLIDSNAFHTKHQLWRMVGMRKYKPGHMTACIQPPNPPLPREEWWKYEPQGPHVTTPTVEINPELFREFVNIRTKRAFSPTNSIAKDVNCKIPKDFLQEIVSIQEIREMFPRAAWSQDIQVYPRHISINPMDMTPNCKLCGKTHNGAQTYLVIGLENDNFCIKQKCFGKQNESVGIDLKGQKLPVTEEMVRSLKG